MFLEMIKEVLNYIASEGITVVYAHNGNNFDYVIMMRYILKLYQTTTDVIGSLVIKATSADLLRISMKMIKGGDLEIKFKDSYRILERSLDDLSEKYGYPKKEPFPYREIT